MMTGTFGAKMKYALKRELVELALPLREQQSDWIQLAKL